jgi:hypothetical protein
MKAHDRRFEVLEGVRRLVAEGCSTGMIGDGVHVNVILSEIRGEQRPPNSLTMPVRLRLSMTEEVYVHRFCALGTYNPELGPDGIHAEHGAGKRSYAARTGYCNGECATLHTSHGRLNDRVLNLKQILQDRPRSHATLIVHGRWFKSTCRRSSQKRNKCVRN